MAKLLCKANLVYPVLVPTSNDIKLTASGIEVVGLLRLNIKLSI